MTTSTVRVAAASLPANQLDRTHHIDSAGSGGPSAMTSHRAGPDRTANHQDDSKETRHV
jgi:hypothetical protein